MKKSFFKKLSFILALAMLVTMIAPAAGAFAASSPALNSAKKYLFLGEEGKNEFDFNIKNKVAGSTYKWSSADSKIAAVDKAGLVTAASIGTTKITVVISKKGKKDVKLSATVIVKDNIKSVAVSNKPEKAIAVGAEYDFNRSFTTFGGSTKKTTAKSAWIVDKADKATISATGVFKATEAGTYKVTVLTFQSTEKYNTWKALNDTAATAGVLASNSVEVKVAASMTVAQKDLDTVEVKFDTAMTDIDKNISFYTMVGATEVKVTTAKPATVSTDKKTATFDFYVPFTEEATYIVKYTDIESVKFTTAVAKAENVVSVKVNTTEVVVGEQKDVSVSLVDANGVDIANTTLLSRVDYTTSSAKSYMNGKTLSMFSKGESTTVTATFHSQKWDNAGKEIGNLTGAGTVVCVDAASQNIKGINAWTIAGTSDTPDFSKPYQKIAANDGAKKLFVKLDTITGTTAGSINSKDDAAKFKFESSDSSILLAYNDGSIFPVKSGTANVVIKVNDKAIDVITINVSADRAAAIMEPSKTDVSVSNTTSFSDTVTVNVVVKDQLGDNMDLKNFSIEKTSYPAAKSGHTTDLATASVTADPKKGAIVVNGYNAEPGSYQYKVTSNTLVRYIYITVLEPANSVPSGYQLFIGTDSDNKVDSKSTAENPRPTVSVDLFGMAGTKTTKPVIDQVNFKVEVVDKDNAVVSLTGNSFDLTSISGSAIAPVKDGSYRVTAYQKVDSKWNVISSTFFTVVNTQVHPTVAEVKSQTYNTSDLDSIARANFKVIFNGKDVTGTSEVTMGDVVGSVGQDILVKNIKYTETIGAYKLTHTIAIDPIRLMYK